MALYKKIVTMNGIVTQYHRIIGVTKKGNCLSVTVGSYVSSDYRAIEGDELRIDIEKFKALRDRVRELSVKENKTEDDMTEYTQKRRQFFDLGLAAMNAKSPKIMAVQNMLFMVPLEGDEISYSMIYDELKKTEDFYGAEDC